MVSSAIVAFGLLAALPPERDVSKLVYPSVDGLEVKAVLSIPKGEGPFPLVVTVHGGNTVKSYGYLRTMAAPNRVSSIVNDLNQELWAILAVSYRTGVMNLGDDDVIAGIRFGMGLPRIDRHRVALVGGSHGGYKVLQAAIRMGTEIRCVSAGSPWMVDPVTWTTADETKPPFSVVPDEVRSRLADQGRSLFRQLSRWEGSDENARDLLSKRSALTHSQRIQVPLLLLTSRSDASVPHEFVAPLWNAMRARGQPVEIFTVDASPHGFYWGRPERGSGQPPLTLAQLDEVRRTSSRLLAFLRAHLK